MDVDESEVHELASIAARGVWESVWCEIERLVAETRDALASHRCDSLLAARRLEGGAGRVAGELVIGRTHLRVECPLRCAPLGEDEASLHDVFGAATPLARIFVLRDAMDRPPLVESVLVADPVSGLWVTTEPELGPFRLADARALEAFFWSLLNDRRV